MERLASLDTSFNKSQPGSGWHSMNENITTKALARKMDSKNGGSTGTAGTAKDDSLTSYNCGQVGHICCNCPNWDLIKKLLKQALVGKDAPNTKSGSPQKDKKMVHAPTGQKESGWYVEENKTKQETDSKQ